MPDSIRFWKARINRPTGVPRRHALRPVGRRQVVVREGGPAAEPRPGQGRAIELEATADGTEARLLAAIRREFPRCRRTRTCRWPSP
ncbi:MAG: hypothetical protein U0800_13320 [Isosphaeraceae bacterium]